MSEFSFDENGPEIPSAVQSAASEILDAAPGISQHAIDAHERERQEAEANVERDDTGAPFDPAIHTGTKLKNGTWRLKKGARASMGSQVAKPRGKSTAVPAQQENANAQQEANCRAAGATAAASVFMLGRAFGGEEWEPSEAEVKMQTDAWTGYFMAKGVTDIPPGLTLLIALGSYAGPRFTMPKTKERTRAIKKWIVLRVAKWKLARALKKEGVAAKVEIRDGDIYINGTRSDLWDNGKREDASSKKPR